MSDMERFFSLSAHLGEDVEKYIDSIGCVENRVYT